MQNRMVEDIVQDRLDISADIIGHAERHHLGRVNRGGTEERDSRGFGQPPPHTTLFACSACARRRLPIQLPAGISMLGRIQHQQAGLEWAGSLLRHLTQRIKSIVQPQNRGVSRWTLGSLRSKRAIKPQFERLYTRQSRKPISSKQPESFSTQGTTACRGLQDNKDKRAQMRAVFCRIRGRWGSARKTARLDTSGGVLMVVNVQDEVRIYHKRLENFNAIY